MDFKIGIEMREEYKRLEVAKGALKLMRDVMLVKPGEEVVISYDTCVDERVVRALAEATYAIDGVPTVVYSIGTGFYADSKPTRPFANAISECDVWVELAYEPIMHSAAYRKSVDENGARYICATGMDVEMLVNCVGSINYDKVIELGEYFKALLEKTDEIEIKSENGTNLCGRMGGRNVRHSGVKATMKGYPIMLAGQTSFCPIEETIEGTLVFDGGIFPPEEIGMLSKPVFLELKKGTIIDIHGESEEAKMFKDWLDSFNDPNMYRLAHYSQGFNPGVTKMTGRIVEDERVFGCMEFGIGSKGSKIGGPSWDAASHTDGITLKPTIILDGITLEEDGIYIDETARRICRELGVNGY
jgi:leucyl aminopeptidase (aminopeptidase T)